MIISNITLNNVEIPVNDNLIGTSTSLNTSSPSNNDILPTYETIDNIPVITPGTGSVFPDNPALLPKITTLSELLNYLSEVMIRFNSNPKYYMQDDFALLIKTITNSLIYLYTTGGSTISTGIPFIGIANLLTNPGNDAIAAGNNFPGIYYAQDTGTYPYFYNTVITVEQRLNSIVLLIPTIVNEICVGYTTSVYNIDVYTKTSTYQMVVNGKKCQRQHFSTQDGMIVMTSIVMELINLILEHFRAALVPSLVYSTPKATSATGGAVPRVARATPGVSV